MPGGVEMTDEKKQGQTQKQGCLLLPDKESDYGNDK
jgi:hypothetical protein